MAQSQRITFRRFGRSFHLRISNSADLWQVPELGESHWVATSAPIDLFNCDKTFLDLLDHDNNSRITSRDVKLAIEWIKLVLSDYSAIDTRSTELLLNSINTDCEQGQLISSAIKKIFHRIQRSEDLPVTLDDVRLIRKQIESTPVSEAGVVLVRATEDGDLQAFLSDILATVGGTPHPCGADGVSNAQLDKFLAAAQAWLAWNEQGNPPQAGEKNDIYPLAADTASAYSLYLAIRPKIEQYFAQCQALALDERFVQRMGWTDAELDGLDFDDPQVIDDVLAKAPIAKARADGKFVFDQPINPHYMQLLSDFRQKVIPAIVPQAAAEMSPAQWNQIKTTFAAHGRWVQSEPNSGVSQLGAQKLRKYLNARYVEGLKKLVAESSRTAFDMNNIRLVEKVILFQSGLLDLANNFVSFPNLYDPGSRAMFEAGTLIMDERRFNFAVMVKDRSAHAQLAKTSNMFVMYVKVAGVSGQADYEVALPVTSGGKGNLCVGKRGVFHDLDRTEHDAVVTAIIDNPISMREALVSPFQRLGRLLTGKIESLTAQAEKKLDTSATSAMGSVTSAKNNKTASASGASTAGMLAGGGVAIAALGSAWAYIAKTLGETSWITIVVGILVAVLVVLLPTSIIAILKLRRRDLSAILEGSQWAINSRMRLTRKQGKYFTPRPRYPKGAKGVSRLGLKGWVILIVAAVLILSIGGYVFGQMQSRKSADVEPKTTTTQPAESNTQ